MDVSTADAWKCSVLMLKQAKLEIAPNPVSVTQPQPAGQKLILLKFPAADIGVCRTRPLSLTPVYGVGAVGLRSVAVRCLSHPAVGEQSSAVLYGCGGGALWFSAPSCLQLSLTPLPWRYNTLHHPPLRIFHQSLHGCPQVFRLDSGQ